jgi:hypothetical protein
MHADDNFAHALKALHYPRWPDETFSQWSARYGLVYSDAFAHYMFGLAPIVPQDTARPE